MFRQKEPTEQELVSEMQRVGISTKTATSGRQEKFGAFREYASERQSRKPGFAPVNPYANINDGQGNPYGNPYSQDGNGGSNGNLHGGSTGNPYGGNTGNPYGGSTGNPYGGSTGNPYSRGGNSTTPHTNGGNTNPYASGGNSRSDGTSSAASGRTSQSGNSASPYAGSTSRARREAAYNSRQTARDDELTLDLNAIPSELPPLQLRRPVRNTDTETLDLNANSDEEDLNVGDDFLPEQEQVNLEDEEVEAIKQDIRFVKQESVQLTRNTLAHAMQADALGTNTLGVLGSQSERLYNAEQNLLLGETQTQIADEKVKELRRLNRSIFIPATGNPFNKKLRLRQQEVKLKTQKEQEKYLRETNRQGMYASEQRVKEGLTSNATSSDTYNKYQGERHLQQAQRYQFENDSEDDEMEKELASNLDQIASYSKKLRNTANLMGQEVDAQNERLKKIEEDADRLDINVHLNTTRLHNIR